MSDMSRTVLEMMREAGEPVTIQALADQVIADCTLDPTSLAVRTAMVTCISRAIRHQRERGVIRQKGRQGRSRLWEIAA